MPGTTICLGQDWYQKFRHVTRVHCPAYNHLFSEKHQPFFLSTACLPFRKPLHRWGFFWKNNLFVYNFGKILSTICIIWTWATCLNLAAEFAANGRPDDFCVDGTAPYAELWMGTHPNGPSMLKGPGALSLAEHISQKPEILGKDCRQKFGDQLPFLFKVLSVNKALSIQAHPDKKHAEKLHADRPDIYKDPNHKPEMAIALTDFEGLCGFRHVSHVQLAFVLIHLCKKDN